MVIAEEKGGVGSRSREQNSPGMLSKLPRRSSITIRLCMMTRVFQNFNYHPSHTYVSI
jgi:hypothetical protein